MTLEDTLYHVKYTAGSYADAISSIPIWTAEKISSCLEKKLGEKTPEFFKNDYTQANSRVYKARENLRSSLDTRPGTLYLQSNLVALIPFFILGMPAAELAQTGIEKMIANAPPLVKQVTNSLATLAVQMTTSYVTFIVNEVRANKEKYVNENGKLSVKKIGSSVKKALKGFLAFDLSFIAAKTAGQSYLLSQGKDPWKASSIFDSIAFPLWYTIAIPIGLKSGLIVNKTYKQN